MKTTQQSILAGSEMQGLRAKILERPSEAEKGKEMDFSLNTQEKRNATLPTP